MRMDEDQIPPTSMHDEPALVLEPGVPYVPDWTDAHQAVAELVVELAGCGLAGRLPHARAEITSAGVGVVDLGRVSPDTARLLARLLAGARVSHLT
jgi:hypothetical protein